MSFSAFHPTPPLQDLIISAFIPPEYQQLIMSRCRWEEGAQRWAVDHIEWAGNLARCGWGCTRLGGAAQGWLGGEGLPPETAQGLRRFMWLR